MTEGVVSHADCRFRLQRALQDASPALLDAFEEFLGELPIEILTEPACGFVMAKARDCFDTEFYLGEALVTTAEVQFQDQRAVATVLGDEPRKAVLSAAASAVLDAGDESAKEKLRGVITRLDEEYSRRVEQDARLAASTRVRFETMVEG